MYQLFARSLGHQQPAGLLQHVPRVLRLGAEPDHRHRQGHRVAGGHPRRRTDLRRRPEPGHQPPADALRAEGVQGQGRQGRGREPAAGGRPVQLQGPADRLRRGRRRHAAGRRVPADQGRRGPGAVPGAGPPAAGGGGAGPGHRRRPCLHRGADRRLRRLPRGPPGPRLGRDREGHRAVPAADRRRGRDAGPSPRPPSSAGRWA